jgi:transposase
MTAEDELIQLREAKRLLHEQVGLQKQVIAQQQEHIRLLEQQAAQQQEQMGLLVTENSLLAQRVSQLTHEVKRLTAQVKTLQERLTKDSHNSHLPPSSDRFTRQPRSLRKKSGKKSGGQAGHPGQSLSFSPTPDEVVVHAVRHCQHCQADLGQVPAMIIERRQVVEVPLPRVLVREHQAEQKHCPVCQQQTRASFPAEVRAPVQYGSSIGAIAVYLVQQQLLPWARACEVMEDLLGIQLCEGTLRELIERCAEQLTEVEQQIKQALGTAQVLHQDETGLYVAASRLWMHVTSTGRLTHYQVHPCRGHDALEAIGILPGFRGMSVHDGFGSYFRYDCQHALCNVHVLRDLIFLAEEQGWWWAAKLKRLLLDMKEATEHARAEGKHWLHPLEVVDWERQFLALLDEGDQAHPRATAPPGHRGRVKQSAARNLLDRLRTYQHAVLAFLEDLRVPFDNNLAERDLRMVKVQQKVSGCFRTLAGAHAFARIRGYLSTLRKQGIPLLSALQATLLGHPVLPSFQTT